MNAVYDKTQCPHYLCGDPATFLTLLKNFPTSLAEVTPLRWRRRPLFAATRRHLLRPPRRPPLRSPLAPCCR